MLGRGITAVRCADQRPERFLAAACLRKVAVLGLGLHVVTPGTVCRLRFQTLRGALHAKVIAFRERLFRLVCHDVLLSCGIVTAMQERARLKVDA